MLRAEHPLASVGMPGHVQNSIIIRHLASSEALARESRFEEASEAYKRASLERTTRWQPGAAFVRSPGLMPCGGVPCTRPSSARLPGSAGLCL